MPEYKSVAGRWVSVDSVEINKEQTKTTPKIEIKQPEEIQVAKPKKTRKPMSDETKQKIRESRLKNKQVKQEETNV